MTREEFAEFLGKFKETDKNRQDIDVFAKKYEYRNIYFYNDGCIKKILASEKSLALTTDLVKIALGLMGADRIANSKLMSPFILGELGYRSVEPNILLTNDCGKKFPKDGISIEVQHEDYKFLFKDRLVLYVARLTNNIVKQGETPCLDNLHIVNFQFFDALVKSPNYCHTIQKKKQKQEVYFDRAMAKYEEKTDIAKKKRDKGADISFIVETTGLLEAEIRTLK